MVSSTSLVYADEGSYDLRMDDRIFTVNYESFTGAKISRVISSHGMALNIEVEGIAKNGMFTLTFPRELLDNVFTGHEISIYVDEVIASYEIAELSCNNVTMQFFLEAGTEEIVFTSADLPGTHLHPRPQIFQPAIQTKVAGEQVELFSELDSKICGFKFDPAEKLIRFDLERAPAKEAGNFIITLPHNILGGNYTVLADGKVIPHSEEFISRSRTFPASLHDMTRIWFDYDTSATRIEIMGQTAIPEFGSVSILLSAAGIATTVAALRMKLRK